MKNTQTYRCCYCTSQIENIIEGEKVHAYCPTCETALLESEIVNYQEAVKRVVVANIERIKKRIRSRIL